MRHEEHAGLQIGNDVGTEREVPVGLRLAEAGKLGALVLQPLSQLVSLRAVDGAASRREPLDVGAQLLVERGIVGAIHGHVGSDFAPGNGAEVDARDGTVGQHVLKVALPLLDSRCGVPVEAYRHLLRHRLRAHACLSVTVAGVEREAHDLKLMIAATVALQGVELVNLVHLYVEEVLVGLSHALHEGSIGHVGVNLLDNQALGTLGLVLVGALRVHLLLPSLLALQVLSVTAADVGHDAVDGFRDTILTGSRSRHQAVHQRGLVLHVVDIAEARLVQMGTERGEYRVSHSRTVDVGRVLQQQLDQRRQPLRHLRRHSAKPRFRVRGIHFRREASDDLLKQFRHRVEPTLTSRMDESSHLVFRQSISGHDGKQRLLVVIRDVAQVRGKTVQPVVALSLLRLAARTAEPLGDDVRVGDALEICWSCIGYLSFTNCCGKPCCRPVFSSIPFRVIVAAVLRPPVNRQPSVRISLAALGNLLLRQLLIPPVGTIDLVRRRRDIDEPLRRKARRVALHAQRLAIRTLSLGHRHPHRQPDVNVQLTANRIVLVQHHPLPLAASFYVQPFRHLVGLLHQLRVINVDARLPRERLRHDVLTVAIVVAKLGVVRAAERQPRLHPSLLLLVSRAVDARCQLLQPWLPRQRVVVLERAFGDECPCLLPGQSCV